MLGNMFSSACNVDIVIDGGDNRKTAALGKDRQGERAYIFTDGEDVCGTAIVNIRPGNKLDHQGIRVELVGQLDMPKDKTKTYDFFCITKDVEAPGTTFESKQYKWKFGSVDKQQETYSGINVRLRYFVRLVVNRGGFSSNYTKEVDLAVQNLSPPPQISNSIKMEVGIADCLHIEFEYDKAAYHMRDVVSGKVYFLLVRIKIKHMELNIIRRESTGSQANQNMDSETLTKFEIMDGAPVKDECIPVRLYLTGFDLTPTFKTIQNKFSVRYYLNLVLVDEEDRRYFKQQEITIYRNRIG